MRTSCNKAGDVCDVSNERCTDLVGDRGEARKVNCSRDRGATTKEKPRPFPQGELAHVIEIDPTRACVNVVLDGSKPFAGDGDVPAVRQMAAHRQAHPHHCVSRLAKGQIDSEVRRRARIWLHVRMIGAEQLLSALDRQRLEAVNDLLSFVVAPTRVTLRVLVREHTAERFENRTGDVVLRCDQADRRLLPFDLVVDQGGDRRVDVSEERLVENGRAHRHLLIGS
jgi:hypothetical protein